MYTIEQKGLLIDLLQTEILRIVDSTPFPHNKYALERYTLTRATLDKVLLMKTKK